MTKAKKSSAPGHCQVVNNYTIEANMAHANSSIDSLLDVIIRKKGASGVSAAIVQQGKVIFCNAGHISRDSKDTVDERTIFEIGSVTKLFTALSLADMVSEGKLQLSDILAKFFPGIKDSVGSITVEQLGTHTSGLPRLPPNLHWRSPINRKNPYARYTLKDLKRSLATCSLKSQPGEKYEYSNYGYGVLSSLLIQIDGDSNCEMLYARHIHNALGLSHTSTQDMMWDNNVALGYTESGRRVKAWHFQSMAGAGAIRSNVRDMTAFLQAFMFPDSIKDERLSAAIKETEVPRFKVNDKLSIGLGWHMSPFNDDTLYWHNGGTGGFSSFIGFLKRDKKGIVLLANSSTRSVDELAFDILKHIEGDEANHG